MLSMFKDQLNSYHQRYRTSRSGDTIQQTPIVKEKKKLTRWNRPFFWDVVDSSTLCVKVYQKHRLKKEDELVGTLTYTIEEITGKLNDGVFEGRLRKDTSDGSDLGRIAIKFAFAAQPPEGANADQLQATAAVDQLTKGIGKLGSYPAATDLLASVVETGTSPVTGVLLQRLEMFNKITTDIAAIHPYASMAWSVISAVNKVLINQKNRDERIISLGATMSDVFAFVDDAEPLKKIKIHEETITLLLQQVTECGYFIADYTKPNSFWIRTAKYAISEIDARIAAYENKLRELKVTFLEGVTLRTGITVVRMMDVVQDITKSIDLNDMPYGEARYVQEKICLPGTRESLLLDICDVLNDPAEDAPRVCLLTGLAGSGKSAVAHSIARLYDGQERLASSCCFVSTDVKRLNPQNLFSTIARDLCDHNPDYKSALWGIVKNNRALRTSTSPSEQLERFIVEPSGALDSIGPQMVVIIDALDESGKRDNRRVLLQAISKQIAANTLPKNLRFLITARPESDILDAFSSASHFVHKKMGDIPEEIVERDIKRFIHHSLDRYGELELSWPDGKWCELLSRRSQCLFQWAATACKFIQEVGANPCEQVDLLLRGDHGGSVGSLDELYLTILCQLFTSDRTRQSFQEVMAVILALHEPLSLVSFSSLFHSNTLLGVRYIIKPMGSLLDGVLDEEKPIRPLHTSFRDFLLDGGRSSTFHIHIPPHHSLSLGRALLACMRDKLRFNICDLKDSRLPNVANPGLDNRVKMAIPPHLSYSCRYWMDHLQYAECTPELLKETTSFFKDFFPYWLEAISLLSCVLQELPIHSAQTACTLLSTWAKSQELSILASEASRFIQVFSPIIQGCTPHLYLSAMPQTPTSSPLCKLWHGHLQKYASMTSGHPAGWPAEVHILQGHTDQVMSVAYSPDGKHIVSGSSDNTIRVWDATTGNAKAGPFQGHTAYVNSVAYSCDGKHIITGSSDKTIRVWDATTGETVAGPLQGHTHWVSSVAYSPDGKHIVSGSGDKTIKVWDATTGQTMAGSFHGHTSWVNSVAYSPDGKHIVSGSHDKTIRVWNATTGKTVAGPFHRHTDIVSSIAYSPDGKHIVSGSYDETIIVWDATTGEIMAGPFQGHTDQVMSVAYSPDGKHIVSGSLDNTIRVWDATTGNTMAGPFQGHIGSINSVAYSPNGKHIVFGSRDKIVRVWDTTTGKTVIGLSQGHTGWVNSIAYSPNGKHIVSGSEDETIRVWDATTGQTVAGPFQGHTGLVNSVVYSPNGKSIVSGSEDKTIRVWNATTGQTMAGPFQGHMGSVNSVAYSPDGKHIVSGSEDETIRVWDITTGQTGLFQGHTSPATSVAYSPDGKHIVSGSEDEIMVWDAATGQTVAGPFQGHTSSLAYSPDGKHVASGSYDEIIRVWDITTGKTIAGLFQKHTDQFINCIAYSHDGKHILSGSYDGTIVVWDTTTGEMVTGPFHGHTKSVNSIAYSPDGKHIASGSADKSIRVWDMQLLTSFHSISVVDGWLHAPNSAILGWVAPWNRHLHWLPCHSLIISPDHTYEHSIDGSLFGESWMSCWK